MRTRLLWLFLLILAGTGSGCFLLDPDFEADVKVASWNVRECGIQASGFRPIEMRVEVKNTGRRTLEYIQTWFYVDVEVNGLTPQEAADLAASTTICKGFTNGICSLEAKKDWLIFLSRHQSTWRDFRFGGSSQLRTFVGRTQNGSIGAVREVRLFKHNFWYDDPAG